MSQKGKKSDNEKALSRILLATAIVKLLIELVDLISHLID